MIRVKKGKAPDFLLSETVTKRKELALIEKDSHDFQTYHYGNKKKVLPSLYKIYQRKCCYCESGNIRNLQVEHFRPEKTPIECDSSKKHFGYYWLGYEWDNLLLCCSTCNQYKSNHFPLENESNRAHKPEDNIINEIPQLFNPDTDNVFDHFIFEYDAQIKGITKKGEKTIEILKLNDTILLKARNEIINDYIKKFYLHFKDFRESLIKKETLRLYLRRIFTEIKHRRRRSESHTFFSYYFYFHFEHFVNERSGVETPEKQQIIKAYNLFIAGKL